jgi:hypothetical protein
MSFFLGLLGFFFNANGRCLALSATFPSLDAPSLRRERYHCHDDSGTYFLLVPSATGSEATGIFYG